MRGPADLGRRPRVEERPVAVSAEVVLARPGVAHEGVRGLPVQLAGGGVAEQQPLHGAVPDGGRVDHVARPAGVGPPVRAAVAHAALVHPELVRRRLRAREERVVAGALAAGDGAARLVVHVVHDRNEDVDDGLAGRLVRDAARGGVPDRRRDERAELGVRRLRRRRARADVAPGAGLRGLVARVLEEPLEPAARAVVRGPALERGDVVEPAQVLDGGEPRAHEPGRRGAVHQRAVVRVEVVEIGEGAVVVPRDRDAVIEGELAVPGAQRGERGEVRAREAVAGGQRAPHHPERGPQRRGRREREVPHRELHRDDRRGPPGGRDGHGPPVRAGDRVRGDEHLGPDRAALGALEVERKGVPGLADDLVDRRDQRVRPATGPAVRRGGAGEVDEPLRVQPGGRDRGARGALEDARGRLHPARGAGDDHLERLELVPRRGDARDRVGPRRRARQDLLRRGRDPDRRQRRRRGGGGDREEEHGEQATSDERAARGRIDLGHGTPPGEGRPRKLGCLHGKPAAATPPGCSHCTDSA